jgi:hypothetical protein
MCGAQVSGDRMTRKLSPWICFQLLAGTSLLAWLAAAEVIGAIVQG